MNMSTKLQANIPFGEALEKIPTYEKFMKDFLARIRKPRDDENICLTEECSEIIQRKLPPRLTDLGCLIIPCLIDKLKIEHTLVI